MEPGSGQVQWLSARLQVSRSPDLSTQGEARPSMWVPFL